MGLGGASVATTTGTTESSCLVSIAKGMPPEHTINAGKRSCSNNTKKYLMDRIAAWHALFISSGASELQVQWFTLRIPSESVGRNMGMGIFARQLVNHIGVIIVGVERGAFDVGCGRLRRAATF